MLDKIKTVLVALLIGLVVFAVGYSLIVLIIKGLEKPTLLTMENLSEYEKEGKVIYSYDTYYFLDSCLLNFIGACEQEKYEELYTKLFINDYKKQFGKEDVVNYLKSIPAFHGGTENKYYEMEYKLNKAYSINDEYLLDVDFNKQKLYLIFRIDESGKSEYDYEFAFLK